MKYVGIDVGGTNLKAGLVDESGLLLATTKMKIARIDNQENLAWTMASMIQDLAEATGTGISEIASVGVGVPGAVEIRSGTVLYTCNLPLRNVPLRRLFHRYLPQPLYVENDGNCAAVGEYFAGAGRNSKRFVTVTLGTGIGGGIIHNGRIFHGSNGMAGEVGHMTIVHNGHPCPCGRKGCWEQYAAAPALIRRTRAAMKAHPESLLHRLAAEQGTVDGRTPFLAAEAGDETALALCRDYVEDLAEGTANLVNLLRPEAVAFGGGVAGAPETLLLEPLRHRVGELCYSRHGGRSARILRAELGNDAGIIGAALLCRATST